MLTHRGNVFVISAPSGTGKSTLTQRLVRTTDGIIFSTSFTTRPARSGEIDGRDYFFVDDAKFESMVRAGEFVEWVEVYNRRYGTGRAWMENVLETGMDLILDIETTGALNLRRAIPDAVMVFIMPPSADELERRIRHRGKDTEDQILMRMQHALHELKLYHAYDFLIVNESLDQAYGELESIVRATRARRERMIPDASEIIRGFEGAALRGRDLRGQEFKG